MSVGTQTATSRYSACLICRGNEWALVREAGDIHRPSSDKVYRLTKCNSCGQVMQNPLPDRLELSEAYSVEYAPYQPAWKEKGWPAWKILRALTMSRRVARLKRYARGSELLEVGSGAGDFLLAAHRAGWNVRAVEYSKEMAEAVRDELGFDVRAGELQVGLWPNDQFDVVAFWNVLEHLPDPLETLLIAADYLRPGGTVILNIPSRDAAERGKRFGKHWALLDLPRHLYFFDRATLSSLCEKAGLRLIEYKTPLLETAWCYLASSWRYANRSGGAVKRLARFAGLAAAFVFMLPYFAVESFRRRGTEAFAIAMKE